MLFVACGGEAAGPSTTVAPATTSTTTPAPLPPHTLDQLAPILDPLVEPLGFRVTRAALISLDDYEPSPDGTHLAVYVVPLTDQTPDEYAAQIVPLAAALLPEVFDRWPALASFDVCQEPYEWDGEGTPPSWTILDLDRASAAAVEWDSLELSELVAISRLDRDVTLSVRTEVGRSDTFRDAVGEGT